MVEEEKSNKHPEIFADLKKKWGNNYNMIKFEYEAYVKEIKS